MIDHDEAAVAASLTDDLAARLHTILRPAGPTGIEEADRLAAWVAGRVAPSLCSDDEHEVADAVIDLASALDIGEHTDPEWWATPVGQICAASLAGVTTDQVAAIQAARMLGIGKARVYQLIDAGRLERHPDGGVTLASVYQRMTTRS